MQRHHAIKPEELNTPRECLYDLALRGRFLQELGLQLLSVKGLRPDKH